MKRTQENKGYSGLAGIATGRLGLQWVTWDCSGSTAVAAGWLLLWTDVNAIRFVKVAAYLTANLWDNTRRLKLFEIDQVALMTLNEFYKVVIVTRRYSDNKCKFKDKWFNKKTVEQARHEKPPKWKAEMLTISFYSKAEMKAIQDAITAGAIPPKTDRQILAEVTRSTNRAHIAGVGGNLASTAIWILGGHNRTLCQQGTPASQFQIPNLYTPQVFPDSISTPGGPSSTSPAPSSTPLGLGNCYTLTFDPETSRSGE
ncbi:hypothetical protein Tco_0250324 [Tanacetum coccineum]